MLKTEKSAGIQVNSQSSMPTILSADTLIKLILSSKDNAKKEILLSNKDGHLLKFKKIKELPPLKTKKLGKQDKDFMVTFIH